MSTSPIKLGQYATGQRDVGSGSNVDVLDDLLGTCKCFQTLDYRSLTPDGGHTRLSAGLIKARLVRNETGSGITPGHAVVLSTATDGAVGAHEVTAYATSFTDVPSYIADPFVTSTTIPNKALFWIITGGVVQFICGATVSRGDLLVPTTGGKLTAAVADTAGSTVEQRWAALGKVLTGGDDGDRGWAAIFSKYEI